MLLGLAQQGVHRLHLGKPQHGNDGEREDRVALTDQEHKPIDGRVPGWVKRHDPVDGADTHGDGIDQNAKTTEVLQPHLPEAHVGMSIGIALQAPTC